MRKKLVECKSIPARLTPESARMVDDAVKGLPDTPDYRYRTMAFACKSEEVRADERVSVGMVTTDAVDLDNERVMPDGVDLDAYRKTMVVLWNHDPGQPIGKCQWIKPAAHGLKAATKYTDRPGDWNTKVMWLPDFVWAMVKAGTVVGHSIGFKPLEMREPTPEEREAAPNLERVITKAILGEYSVVSTPCCPDALIEVVKSLPLSLDVRRPKPRRAAKVTPPRVPYREIAAAVRAAEIDVDAVVRDVLTDYLQRGRL